MKKIRNTIKLILLTYLTDEEIGKIVGLPSFIIGRLRQEILVKKCEWQKIKAMCDIELKELFMTNCSDLASQIFLKADYVRHKPQPRELMLNFIWDEYRRAGLYDAQQNSENT